MLRAQVLAMRAGAAAQVAMADAILRALDGAPAEPVPTASTRRDGAPCAHPAASRLATPRMGLPNAWLCTCGYEGAGVGDAAPVTAVTREG